MSDSNPYRSPAEIQERIVVEITPIPLGRLLVRWTLVCGISAAPSFYFGLMFGRDVYHISAMVCGVLLYVLVYVYLDNKIRPRIAPNATLQRSIRIGYWVRVIVSIAFPVAMFVDMMCGIVSTSVIGLVPALGQYLTVDANNRTGMVAFVAIFLTTILQGALLHVVLFGFMGIVYGIQIAVGLGAAEDSLLADQGSIR